MTKKTAGGTAKTASAAKKPAAKAGGNANTATDAQKANVAPATKVAPSGAPEQVTEIDLSHPAVDSDPRADTTADQNRIDFNNPEKSGSEAVTDNLKAEK